MYIYLYNCSYKSGKYRGGSMSNSSSVAGICVYIYTCMDIYVCVLVCIYIYTIVVIKVSNLGEGQ
jgi:hypothetical protein